MEETAKIAAEERGTYQQIGRKRLLPTARRILDQDVVERLIIFALSVEQEGHHKRSQYSGPIESLKSRYVRLKGFRRWARSDSRHIALNTSPILHTLRGSTAMRVLMTLDQVGGSSCSEFAFSLCLSFSTVFQTWQRSMKTDSLLCPASKTILR